MWREGHGSDGTQIVAGEGWPCRVVKGDAAEHLFGYREGGVESKKD